MFKLVVTGGKGGTGKSFVAVNIAVSLTSKFRVIVADLDLEAPNDHLLLGVKELGRGDEIKLFLPFIDVEKCTGCGVCAKVCDTGAILLPGKSVPVVFPRLCSGCRACYYACPYKAILEGYHVLGYMYVNEVEVNGGKIKLVTGVLREGEEHTPPGVYRVRERALRENGDVIVVDTGAGTGNQVSIALKDADLAIVVTEPTPLGLHDMESILKITSNMGVETWLVINRAGIGDYRGHVETARKYGVEKTYTIPYHRDAVESYIAGKPVVLYKPGSPVSKSFKSIVKDLIEVITG